MKTLKGLILLTRPVNLFIAFLSIFIGGFVTGTIQPIVKLLLACISGMLIGAGGNSINDYYDLEIDRINKPKRPLPAGMVSSRLAFFFSIGLFIVGIVLSRFIHLLGFVIALFASVMLYLYSFHLKRTVLWGNFTVGLLSGLAFVYGGIAVGQPKYALIVGIFALFFHLAREIIKDMEDIRGDQDQGVLTLPIQYGLRAAMCAVTIVLVLLIFLTIIPYILNLFSILYFIVVVLGVDLFLIYVLISMWKRPEPNNLGRLAVMMKVNMLIGLLAVYLGR